MIQSTHARTNVNSQYVYINLCRQQWTVSLAVDAELAGPTNKL